MVRPFIWAHRGASCAAPENTMAAFSRALESGADGIELDLHLSRDGVPVVIHDETLERTTSGQGPVVQLEAAELQQLDAGSWFSPEFAGEPLPTLAEVLEVYGGKLRLNLEIKQFEAGSAVLALLRHHPNVDIVVSSFDHDLLCRMRAADPLLPLAVLLDEGNWRRALQTAVALDARTFHPAAELVTRPMVSACSHAGVSVHVWTVDDPGRARSLIRAGVSGLFTNDPLRMRAAFPA